MSVQSRQRSTAIVQWSWSMNVQWSVTLTVQWSLMTSTCWSYRKNLSRHKLRSRKLYVRIFDCCRAGIVICCFCFVLLLLLLLFLLQYCPSVLWYCWLHKGCWLLILVWCFLPKGRFFLINAKFLCHVLFLSALRNQSHSLHLLASLHPVTLLLVFQGFSFPETFLRWPSVIRSRVLRHARSNFSADTMSVKQRRPNHWTLPVMFWHYRLSGRKDILLIKVQWLFQ